MENQLAVISDYGRQLFFCFFRIYIPGGRDAQSAERGGGGAGLVLLYIQHNPCSLKPPLSADVPYSRSRHYKSKSLHFIQPALRRCHQRVIGMVNHESRCGSGYLFNVLFLDIVDFHLVIVTAFGIVGGQGTGFFKEAVGKVGAALSFYDDMGSGILFKSSTILSYLWRILTAMRMTIKEFFSFKTNKYFWVNIIAMIVVMVVMIFGVLKWLDIHTHHGESVFAGFRNLGFTFLYLIGNFDKISVYTFSTIHAIP